MIRSEVPSTGESGAIIIASMKLHSTFAVVCVLLLPALGSSSDPHQVAPEVAARHLQKSIEPVPPDRQFSLIRGAVVLQVQISETGMVEAVQAVSGHPLLITPAIDAVKQWAYRPFMLNGKPVAVKTSVTIPFYPAAERQEAQRDAARSERFFKTFDLCREQINRAQLAEAEATCKDAVALSLLLNESQQLERMDAVKETGHSLFLQKKFVEALDHYQAELRIGERLLKPYNAELASARHDVGNGLWGTGHLDEAAAQYTLAEDGYKQASTHIDSAFLKNEYAKKLKGVLTDHAALLRQLGRVAEADTLEREASSIVVQQGLRDQ